MLRKILTIFLILAFNLSGLPLSSYAQDFVLPAPGSMLKPAASYASPKMVGLKVDEHDPMRMEFIFDRGQNPGSTSQQKQEYQQLVEYFLVALGVENNQIWVNLSPYEKNRIIPDPISRTTFGETLLAQDYLLKQLSASLTNPDESPGKEYWQRIFSQAKERLGTTNVPVNGFNKVWIIPDKADVYQKGNTAWVLYSHFKVMMDEDYMATQKHSVISTSTPVIPAKAGIQSITKQALQQIIIPTLEKQVNEGAHFAPLRQIMNSLILATWYKKALKRSVLGTKYSSQNKLAGLTLEQTAKQRIYQQYLEAYKKGVFNFIRNEQEIPRKYFSGGITTLNPTDMATVSSLNALAPNDRAMAGEGWKEINSRGLDKASVMFDVRNGPVDKAMAGALPELDQTDKDFWEHIKNEAKGDVKKYEEVIETVRAIDEHSSLIAHIEHKIAQLTAPEPATLDQRKIELEARIKQLEQDIQEAQPQGTSKVSFVSEEDSPVTHEFMSANILFENGNRMKVEDVHLTAEAIKSIRNRDKYNIYVKSKGREPKILNEWEDSHVTMINNSHNGKWLVTGHAGGEIKISDAFDSNKGPIEIGKHDEGIYSVVFSPDDQLMASFSDTDGMVKIWDISNPLGLQQPVFEFKAIIDMRGSGALFSLDGTKLFIAALDYQSFKTWKVIRQNQSPRLEQLQKELEQAHAQMALIQREEGLIVEKNKLLAQLQGAQLGEIDRFETTGETKYLSANGKYAASIRWIGESVKDKRSVIDLWDVDARAFIKTIEESASKVAFSPDGRRLVTCGSTMKLWDVPGSSIQPLDVAEVNLYRAEFSADGELVVGVGRSLIGTWDVSDSNHLKSLELVTVNNTTSVWGLDSLAISPDSWTLATGEQAAEGQDRIRLWDISNPRKIKPLGVSFHKSKKNSTKIFALRFSPHGSILASSDHEGIILWTILYPENVQKLSGPFGPWGDMSLDFSKDSQLLLSSGLRAHDNGGIFLWDVNNPYRPELIKKYEGHQYDVISSIFLPDNTKFMSAGDDRTVRTWKVVRQKETPESTTNTGVGELIYLPPEEMTEITQDRAQLTGIKAISPNGRYALVLKKTGTNPLTYDGEIWDLQKHTKIKTLDEHFIHSKQYEIESIFSSDNERLLISTAFATHIWDVQDPAKTIRLNLNTGHLLLISSFAVSTDRKFLAINYNNGTIQLWNISNDDLRAIGAPFGDGETISAFAPNGEILATSGKDGTVTLWDITKALQTGVITPIRSPFRADQRGPTSAVNAMTFSSDSTRLAVSVKDQRGGLLTVWAVEDPKNTYPVQSGLNLENPQSMTALAFSKDDKVLISGDTAGGVQLWDWKDSTKRYPLKAFSGHSGEVHSLGFSDDHTKLYSASGGQHKTWQIAKRLPVQGEAAVDNERIAGLKQKLQQVEEQLTEIEKALAGEAYALDKTDKAMASELPELEQTDKDFLEHLKNEAKGDVKKYEEVLETVRAIDEHSPLIAHIEHQIAQLTAPQVTLEQRVDQLKEHIREVEEEIKKGVGTKVQLVKEKNAPATSEFRKEHMLHDDGDRTYVSFSNNGIQYEAHAVPFMFEDGNEFHVEVKSRITGAIVKKWDDREITAINASYDGQWLVTGHWGGEVKLWNSLDPNNKIPISIGKHDHDIHSVIFSPDNKLVASYSLTDGVVNIWDISNPHDVQLVEEIPAFSGVRLHQPSFSLDGKKLYIPSEDGKTFRVWKIVSDITAKSLREKELKGLQDELAALEVQLAQFGLGVAKLQLQSSSELVYLPWQEIEEIPSLKVEASHPIVAVSPDRHYAALIRKHTKGQLDNFYTILLWDLKNKRQQKSLHVSIEPSSSVIFSPDSKTVIFTTKVGNIEIYDVPDPFKRNPIISHPIGVTSEVKLAISHDGHMLASATGNKFGLWKITATGLKSKGFIHYPREDKHITTMAFSTDDQILAFGGFDGYVYMVDPNKISNIGKPVQAWNKNRWPVKSIIFSGPRTMITSTPYNIKRWDIKDISHFKRTGEDTREAPSGGDFMAVSPDGRVLATTYDDYGQLELLTLTHPSEISMIRVIHGSRDRITSLIFSEDGTQLFTGSRDTSFKTWQIARRDEAMSSELPELDQTDKDFLEHLKNDTQGDVQKLQEFLKTVTDIDEHSPLIAHIGHMIAELTAPQTPLAQRALDLKSTISQLQAQIETSTSGKPRLFNGEVVAISKDGRYLAVVVEKIHEPGKYQVEIINRQGMQAKVLDYDFVLEPREVVFSPDGEIVAVLDTAFNLFYTESGRPSAPLSRFAFMHSDAGFSPDGKTFYALDNISFRNFEFWNVTDPRNPEAVNGRQLHGSAVAYAPNGEYWIGFHNGVVWRANTDPIGQRGENYPIIGYKITSFVFSEDGTQSFGLSQNTQGEHIIYGWNETNHAPFLPIYPGLKFITAMAISPDNQILALGTEDGTIKLIRHLKSPIILTGHTGRINNLFFSADSKKLVSASDDKTLRTWSIDENSSSSDAYIKDLEGQLQEAQHQLALVEQLIVLTEREKQVQEELKTVKGQGPLVEEIPTGGEVNVVSPDERYAASYKKVVDPQSQSSKHIIEIRDAHSGELLTTLEGYDAFTQNMIFSNDGRWFFASDKAKGILWDIRNIKDVKVKKIFYVPITGAAFSPDSQTLGISSNRRDHTLMWDISNPDHVHDMETPYWGRMLQFSPEKGVLATFFEDRIGISGSNAKELGFAGGFLSAYAFSPDGKIFATGTTAGTIQLWEVYGPNKKPVYTFPGNAGNVGSLAFSLDGKMLFSTDGDLGANAVKVWQMDEGKLIDNIPQGGKMLGAAVSVSKDGKTLYAGPEGFLKKWQIAGVTSDHQTLEYLPADQIKQVDWAQRSLPHDNIKALSPDGHYAALLVESPTKAGQKQRYRVMIWDMVANQGVKTLAPSYTNPDLKMVFSNDSRLLAIGLNNFHLFNVQDPLKKVQLDRANNRLIEPIRLIVFSPDGKSMATANPIGYVRLWNISDLDHIFRYKSFFIPTSIYSKAYPTALAYAPSGQMLAAGDSGGEVRILGQNDLLDVNSGVPVMGLGKVFDVSFHVYSLKFSPDAKTLAIAYDGANFANILSKLGKICFVDIPSMAPSTNRKHLVTGAFVNSMLFYADGKGFAAGDNEGKIYLWNDPNREETLKTFLAHSTAIVSLAGSTDGTKLYSVGGDQTAKAWEIAKAATALPVLSMKEIDRFQLPEGRQIIEVAADGQYVYSKHNTLFEEWDVSTKNPNPRNLHSDHLLAVSPDGQKTASGEHGFIWFHEKPPATSFNPVPGLEGKAIFKFSPDGKLFAGGNDKGEVKVWEVTPEGLKELTSWTMPKTAKIFEEEKNANGELYNAVRSLTFTPDSKVLAIGAQGAVSLYDVNDPEDIQFAGAAGGVGYYVTSIAFTSDSQTMAYTGQETGKILVADVSDPIRIKPLRPIEIRRAGQNVLAFSADGTVLAADDFDKQMLLIDIRKPANPDFEILPVHAKKVLYMPDGKLLTINQEGVLQIWQKSEAGIGAQKITALEEELQKIQAELVQIKNALNAPKPPAPSVKQESSIRLYASDKITSERLSRIAVEGRQSAHLVAYFPDGYGAIAIENRIYLVGEIKSLPELFINDGIKAKGKIVAMAVYGQGDSRYVAYAVEGDYKVFLWKVQGRLDVENVPEELVKPQGNLIPIHSVAFSPQGYLYSSDERSIQVWDVNKPGLNKHVGRSGLVGGIKAMLLSGNGKRIVTYKISDGRSIVLYSDLTGPTDFYWEYIDSFDQHKYDHFAISSDGHHMLLGGKTGALLLDFDKPREQAKIAIGNGTDIKAMAFSNDDRYAAIGDFSISVYDLTKPQDRQIQDIMDIPGDINTLAFSPDNTHLLAGFEHEAGTVEYKIGESVNKPDDAAMKSREGGINLNPDLTDFTVHAFSPQDEIFDLKKYDHLVINGLVPLITAVTRVTVADIPSPLRELIHI